jgi:hypothetical protein
MTGGRDAIELKYKTCGSEPAREGGMSVNLNAG